MKLFLGIRIRIMMILKRIYGAGQIGIDLSDVLQLRNNYGIHGFLNR